jgi:hypothetical protein
MSEQSGASDAMQSQPALEDDEVLLLEEVQDQDLVLAVWEPTGEHRVDAALDLLAQLDPDDVNQHAAVFDEVHQQLRATLTDLDAPSGA